MNPQNTNPDLPQNVQSAAKPDAPSPRPRLTRFFFYKLVASLLWTAGLLAAVFGGHEIFCSLPVLDFYATLWGYVATSVFLSLVTWLTFLLPAWIRNRRFPGWRVGRSAAAAVLFCGLLGILLGNWSGDRYHCWGCVSDFLLDLRNGSIIVGLLFAGALGRDWSWAAQQYTFILKRLTDWRFAFPATLLLLALMYTGQLYYNTTTVHLDRNLYWYGFMYWPLETDRDLELVCRIESLEVLDLSYHDRITDAGLAHLSRLKQLDSLDLHGNRQLTDIGLASLGQLSSLRELNISECEQATDKSIDRISVIPQLESLNLMYCGQLTNVALTRLPATLCTLNLCGCQNLNDNGLKYLKRLPRLESLNLLLNRQLSNAAVQDFQQARPDCRIEL